MCGICGCGQPDGAVTIRKIDLKKVNFGKVTPLGAVSPLGHHDHDHHHVHAAAMNQAPGKTVLQIEQDILGKNNLLAERNKGFFEAKNILALNLVSSPGSGKTALLERTLADLKGEIPCFVIEGDQQTSNDADRIAATGAEVVQINTGKGCHLEADMVNEAMRQLKPTDGSLLFIENVGNLVCPAMFDLGEGARVVIISVTEGDDKPLKYPDMFHSSQLCIINKIDLLPYVNFSVEKVKEYAKRVSHITEFIELSATTGAGMDEWYAWLKKQRNTRLAP
ncbi:MAG: hydrogenase nickel incorporation protein HypB [Saprospiraceae bacterium]|nr:hydrogenase nickel incorporation protein HypB [Saprospiraceae bacterium]